MQRAVVWVSIVLGIGGCASAPSTPQTAPKAEAAAGGTSNACLATAGVKRERRPNEPGKIGAKHVLVKSKESKRVDPKITRTREEACARAMEARDKLRAGTAWEAVVKEYSDEAGAATRGGTVGTVERKEVAPAFADAAFELEVNQMSDVVESEFGFHVILRTE